MQLWPATWPCPANLFRASAVGVNCHTRMRVCASTGVTPRCDSCARAGTKLGATRSARLERAPAHHHRLGPTGQFSSPTHTRTMRTRTGTRARTRTHTHVRPQASTGGERCINPSLVAAHCLFLAPTAATMHRHEHQERLHVTCIALHRTLTRHCPAGGHIIVVESTQRGHYVVLSGMMVGARDYSPIEM